MTDKAPMREEVERCECSDEVIECKSCSNLGSAGYRWLEANGEIGLGRLLNELKVRFLCGLQESVSRIMQS
jgi:hypothetical protein